jgi:hypothetical protein
MRLVVVESPYAGKTDAEIEANVAYARRCLKDCLDRGEAPIASHLLYTQPGVLRDSDPEQRKLGIAAGLAWAKNADAMVIYLDRGVSQGMINAVTYAATHELIVEHRRLDPPK